MRFADLRARIAAFLTVRARRVPRGANPETSRLVSRSVAMVSPLSGARQLTAWCAVTALLALGFVRDAPALSDSLAIGALIAIGVAVTLGCLQFGLAGRLHATKSYEPITPRRKQWILGLSGVAFGSGLMVQTWFRPQTSIANGDIPPPVGTAWLGRLFEPWTWGGSSLGEPSQLPLSLPWAAVLGAVHQLGGDPELAQRIWYTMLFVAAGLGAFSLMAALRMSPLASCIGAAVYVLNPYVVSQVNTNPIFLAALFPLAAIPAALVAGGTSRVSVRMSAVLIALTAPILGYVFANPPLLGLILVVTLGTPLVVAWIDGWKPAMRSFRALLLAVPLLIAASAYWIVPAILHLAGFSGAHLGDISSWSWTETRATLRNAFWLNTIWAWSYPQFFPYAAAFDLPPLSITKFLVPAIAFAAIAQGLAAHTSEQRFRNYRNLRVAVACAAVAVVVLLLSTGTNAPGNVFFDPLYNLPFGWLLREPGRFLILAALAYAVLVAVLANVPLLPASANQVPHRLVVGIESGGTPRLLKVNLPQRRNLDSRLPLVIVALIATVLTSFPLFTGQVVADNGPGAQTPHVHVPSYWTEMAGVVDKLQVQGAIVVLPPDDFYAMPYTWGYYGTDNFIVDLFQRHVLVPNAQGYTSAAEVTAAVSLMSASILRGDWREAEDLSLALNAPLVLVRRDVQTPYVDRSITSPAKLATALGSAPNFFLVSRIGALDLFELTAASSEIEVAPSVATVESQTPDLRMLSLLPSRTALISDKPQLGVANVVESPPLEQWSTTGASFVWQRPAPAGWTYRLADLNTKTIVPLVKAGTFAAGNSATHVGYAPGPSNSAVTVSVAGRSAISNGDFSNGLWSPVIDCNAVNADQARPYLTASVVTQSAPNGLPALQLSALLDSACESQTLRWAGGSLVVSLKVRRVQGNVPRLCLFETGPQRCASLPSIPAANGWASYSAAVTPDTGTSALDLYLYADANSQSRTISEYADVKILEVPSLTTFALFADPQPNTGAPSQVMVVHNSFSDKWQATSVGKHVIVDGMLNGWQMPIGSQVASASYGADSTFRAALWVSLLTLVGVLILAVWPRAGQLMRGLGVGSLKRVASNTRPERNGFTFITPHPPTDPGQAAALQIERGPTMEAPQVTSAFTRLRAEVRNWYSIGLLAAIVMPTRIPPRRGLAGTWLGRRIVTFRMRDGSKIACRLQDAGDLISVYLDRDYASLDIQWTQIRTIVDIGATVGCFTLWALRRAPQARALAIEPNPSVYTFLTKNVAANGLTEKVTTIHAAVGAKPGYASVVDQSFSTLATTIPESTASPSNVAMVTLAGLLDESGFVDCDLLKVDCEGCEYDIFLSADDTTLRRIGAIVCEFHPIPGRSVAELSQRLRTAGYGVTIVGGPIGFLVAERRELAISVD